MKGLQHQGIWIYRIFEWQGSILFVRNFAPNLIRRYYSNIGEKLKQNCKKKIFLILEVVTLVLWISRSIQ